MHAHTHTCSAAMHAGWDAGSFGDWAQAIVSEWVGGWALAIITKQCEMGGNFEFLIWFLFVSLNISGRYSLRQLWLCLFFPRSSLFSDVLGQWVRECAWVPAAGSALSRLACTFIIIIKLMPVGVSSWCAIGKMATLCRNVCLLWCWLVQRRM